MISFARQRFAVSLVTMYYFVATGIATTSAADMQADRLFDSSRLLNVEIELPKEDWDKLRKQTRGRGGFAALFSNTIEKPFTYFRGNVTIDGVKIESVGLRKKGFIGSLDDNRPSLKIKFNEFVDQSPVDGLDRLTLNNNKQDTALVSQFLSYKVFNDAGIHAPRCSLAKVTVNGEYLGIYSNVESYKKPFLKARYGDDTGDLYEGTVTDFYPKTVNKLEAKKSDQDRKSVARLAEILASDEDLPMDELEELVDVDNFLKFWAVESLIGFWDGYTQNQNNFFVYKNPANQKFYFMPWGADSCFTSGGGPFGGFGGGNHSAAVSAESMLANRLFRTEEIPGRYQKALLKVLKEAWNEDEIIAEIDRIEQLTDGQVPALQKNRGGRSSWGGGTLNLDGVRDFVKERREEIMDEFEDWPVEVPSKPRKPMYSIDVGSASGSFTVLWSDDPESDDAEGKVAINLMDQNNEQMKLTNLKVAARPMQSFGFGGRRGPSRWTPPATIVFTGIRDSDDEKITLTLMVDTKELADGEGKKLAFSGSFSEGEQQRGFGFGRGGKSVSGTLTLSKAGTNNGDTIEGKLDAKIVESRGWMIERMRGRGGRRR